MLGYVLRRLAELFVLLLTLLMSAAFTLMRGSAPSLKYPDDIPETYPYFCNDEIPWARWCFNKVELYPDTYYYFIFEELILLVFTIYIYVKVKEFKLAHGIFVLIQLVDVFDYLLSYQKTWLYVSSYPISWNVLKVVVFSLAIVNEALLLLEEKLYSDRWKY